MGGIEEKTAESPERVHKILAHSYSLFFLFFLLGVTLDFIYPIRPWKPEIMAPLGLVFIIWATYLVYWAQKTSRNLAKNNLAMESFCKGPYCYTRTPTHWGLFFLLLGFGFISGTLFVILFTLLAILISRLTFIRKQEKMLALKYGAPYLEYKKMVRF